MESVLLSEDSCEFDLKNLKNQLTEYGLDEENLTKDEMVDLLKALNNSKTTVEEEQEDQKQKDDDENASPNTIMKRHYLNVRDRRMPWCLIPNTSTPAGKARTLAVYKKLMSINNYRQARQTVNMAAWAPPIQIIEATRIQPQRSTRSGRSVPVYDFDDDSSDFDCVITNIKKRKVSNSDIHDVCNKKSLSLKRKLTKDENTRLAKEAKVFNETQKLESDNHVTADIYSIIED